MTQNINNHNPDYCLLPWLARYIAGSSAVTARMTSVSRRVQAKRSSSKPFLTETLTSTSVSGSMIDSVMFVFSVFGKDHVPFTGTRSYCRANIAVTARTSFVAKCRPGHNVVPPLNARKAVGAGRFRVYWLTSWLWDSFINRSGLKVWASMPQFSGSVRMDDSTWHLQKAVLL